MAQLKAGSTVGGVVILTALKPSNLIEGAGSTGQFLGVDAFGNVRFLSSFYTQAQGTITGYSSGGFTTYGGTSPTRLMNKFPFVAPFVSATSSGSLSQGRWAGAGQSSQTEGFTSGGFFNPPSTYVTTIDKFPFTAPFTTATSAGSLSQGRSGSSGQYSTTVGYTSGGSIGPNTGSIVIDSFPFSAPFTTATSVGTTPTTQSSTNPSGHSSHTRGYTSASPGIIYSFPFSAPFTTAVNTGTITPSSIFDRVGSGSSTAGYVSGGWVTPAGAVKSIYRFPFAATPVTSTTIGDLIVARGQGCGQSSVNDGYITGGINYPGSYYNNIESFPFSSPFVTTVDVGNLTTPKSEQAAQQY